MLSNIPLELRSLAQWVVASGIPNTDGKPNKEPLNPRTGKKASVTDPSSWGTFEEAEASPHPLKGFVLSATDPFTIIDLDEPANEEQAARHSKLLETFPTYSEVSQSGNGIHVICRGKVPHGVRRDKIEMYSSGRYMICTGQVHTASAVTDCQDLLDALFEKMNDAGLATVQLEQHDNTEDDETVLQRANRATNSRKFVQLWDGDWQADWPSQSEADFALLSMLCFYTDDNAQVRRLFRQSALGQREKAQRDSYLNYALAKIRAKAPPEVDLTELLANLPPVATEQTAKPSPYTFPPGLVGEIADYILASSNRPVPEISLAAAIGLCSGIVGRSFNISDSGLNQYLIVVARTGRGKEGIAKGIERIVSAVCSKVPAITRFMGPAIFASGPALVKVLDKQPCFVSVLGEFGELMEQICSPRAHESKTTLRRVLLDTYGKSGFSAVLRESVYSDAEKNTKIVQAPNITILGETSPDKLYAALDGDAVASGFLPRFTIIDYDGERVPRNEHHAFPPSAELVGKIADLATVAVQAESNRTFTAVTVEPDAERILNQFDKEADKEINDAASDQTSEVWNRAHLKALKLSALVAVGVNPYNPVVNTEAALWAVKIVRHDITRLQEKFEAGDIGTGDMKMEADVKRAVDDWAKLPKKTRLGYRVSEKLLASGFVPEVYLRQKCRKLAAFKNHRLGSTAALSMTLGRLTEIGYLLEVPAKQVLKELDTESKCYVRKVGG